MVGTSWKDIWNCRASPCGLNILRMVQGAWEAVVTVFKWLVGPLGPRGCGSPSTRLCGWAVSKTDDKNRLKPDGGKGTPLYRLSPRDSQKGGMFKPQRHRRERPQGEPKKGRWTHQRMSIVGCEQGQLGGWVLASNALGVVVGWVVIRVPPGLVGRPDPSHGTKCRP
jgi:hypothetical protein